MPFILSLYYAFYASLLPVLLALPLHRVRARIYGQLLHSAQKPVAFVRSRRGHHCLRTSCVRSRPDTARARARVHVNVLRLYDDLIFAFLE